MCGKRLLQSPRGYSYTSMFSRLKSYAREGRDKQSDEKRDDVELARRRLERNVPKVAVRLAGAEHTSEWGRQQGISQVRDTRPAS